MKVHRILSSYLLVVPLGFAQEVVLHGYQAGGAGGTVALGSVSDSTEVSYGLGGSAGGLVELDDASIAKIGFWGTSFASIPVAIPVRSIAGNSLRAAMSGSRLMVEFQTNEAIDASVRIVGIDGRTAVPILNRRLAPGYTQEAISLVGHEGQALFVLVEAGAQRKVWQFHPVSR